MAPVDFERHGELYGVMARSACVLPRAWPRRAVTTSRLSRMMVSDSGSPLMGTG